MLRRFPLDVAILTDVTVKFDFHSLKNYADRQTKDKAFHRLLFRRFRIESSTMHSGQICARLYSNGVPVQLRWREGIVSGMEPISPELASDLGLLPPWSTCKSTALPASISSVTTSLSLICSSPKTPSRRPDVLSSWSRS